MSSTFQSFLDSIIQCDPILVESVKQAYDLLITSGVDTPEDSNEYFQTVKQPKNQNTTLMSQRGMGRVSFRGAPGKGSLSYNPQDPMQPAYNANTSSSS
jgi:hypothetical protein